MLKGASIIEDWINEAAAQSAEEGERKGRTAEARDGLLRVLRWRFEALPGSLERRIESADLDWCHRAMDRLTQGASLAEIDTE